MTTPRRGKLTRLEREALVHACTEILAGDAVEYFNFGAVVADPPTTADEKHAIRLAAALKSALEKIA